MKSAHEKLLRAKLRADGYQKLAAIPNPRLHQFLAESIELCDPDSVFVCTDSEEDARYIRKRALESGEEMALALQGHTVHFDGYLDQGRDRAVTKYLMPPGVKLGANINSINRQEGLEEIRSYLLNSMRGREMIVLFRCLGPTDSEFAVSGVQATDSAYVAHSVDLLYRRGYEQFKRLGGSPDFIRVLHSSGELRNGVSVNADKKRVYIDLDEETVYSVNTQYAGNTVGFKKLALRLAIRKADREGWLAEHMFLMGVHGSRGRVTYFAGAFPSFCGKTSTAMIPGETIVGDDLAYLRIRDGQVWGANVECGIFGIIQDVNPSGDPVIWQALTTPGEAIFSNVLVSDGTPYWLGDGRQHPTKGVNYSGNWRRGKKDAEGNIIPAAHKNARYTLSLRNLANLDEKFDEPKGVPLGGIIYGGRDSDTWVPVQEAFDWAHGVITMGASLESETTAATLGQEGIRSYQPMSNLDFLSIPLGRYVQNHLDFVRGVKRPPVVFAVNYFLKDEQGNYFTGMRDKNVWLKWMELRVSGELEAAETPTGHIPLYEDLKWLFQQVLGSSYTPEQYIDQFAVRVPENLNKIQRIENIYRTQVHDAPETLFKVLAEQRKRLEDAMRRMGRHISPFDFRPGPPRSAQG